MICLNCQHNIEDKVEFCPFCGAQYNAEKFRFIKYLGDPDSLVGYQKSYKLVLLKTIFSFIINEKPLSVDSIIASIKDYYLERRARGLSPDYEVDARIQNITIETSLYDVWAIFKANPYNAINNQRFLFLEKNRKGELVFAFSSELTESLTLEEYKSLHTLMANKLALYYKKFEEEADLIETESFQDGQEYDSSIEETTASTVNLDLSILDTTLSVRSKNCLMRSGNTTIRSIIDMTDEDLLSIRNMGRKSVEEIRAFICCIKSNSGTPANLSSEDTPPKVICEYDFECGIVNTSLSVRAKNAFARAGYLTVGQIVDLTMSDIMELPNIGRQTAQEMLDFIQNAIQFNYNNETGDAQLKNNPFGYFNEECDTIPVALLSSFNVSKNIIKMLQSKEIYRLGQLRKMAYDQMQSNFGMACHDLLMCDLNVFSQNIVAVTEKLLDFVSSEFDLTFIVERSRGITLAELGTKYNITRERVRQKVEKPLKIIKPMVECLVEVVMLKSNKQCLTLQDVYDLYDNDNYDAIIAYALNESENIETISSLGLFMLKSDVSYAETLSKCIRDFVSEGVFWKQNIGRLSELLQDNGLAFIDVNEVWFYMREMGYKIYKDFVVPQAIPYGNLLAIIIEQEFPYGISFSDPDQVQHLRNITYDRFGDLGLPEGDRPLSARVTEQLVLCDRGKWISPSRMAIDVTTIETIKNYIDNSDDNIIYYQSLYNQFQGLLMMTSDVCNYHYLHGVLRYYYSSEYIFTRDYLQKDGNNSCGSLSSRIYEYILEKGAAVTREELKTHLKITSDVMITNVLSNNRDVFQWEFNRFNCSGNLSITAVENELLNEIILEIMVDNNDYCSAKMVYDYCLQILPEMVQRNQIKNHTNLFYFVATVLWDKFKYRNPHILPLNSEVSTTEEIATKIIGHPEILKWDEFATMSDKFGWGRSTAGFVFDNLKKECYYRISLTDYIKKDAFLIDSNQLTEINAEITRVIDNKEYVGVWEFNFERFPVLRYSWTPHLLESIINCYSNEYKFITPDVGAGKTERGVCVRITSNIATFDQLVLNVMKKNGQDALTDGEMHTMLVIAGVIKHSVPNELKESPLFIYEGGEYKIKEESA